MIETTYNVGIYCRLSNDDERDGESVSIENQKLLLQNYVRQRGWNEIDTYIDDGYSGTNFNRPGVKRLIEDAKAKRINVILVKDLSRFGRNYIEFGQYTDYLFPSLGCRFIALNNGIDTMSDNGSTDVMCFLNLFNEFYSRDTSKKVKAVKKACAESGKFMGTYPAYGYRRDPLDKHHLVIDEETAPIVRRIFAMRASGMGFHAIAAALNEEGIPSPGVLYYQRKGQSDPRRVNHKWADQTVKNMVRSEVYIGNMVQGQIRHPLLQIPQAGQQIGGPVDSGGGNPRGHYFTGIVGHRCEHRPEEGAEEHPRRWLQEYLHRPCLLRRLRLQNAEPHRAVHL